MGDWATGMETASRRGCQRARDLALQHDAPLVARRHAGLGFGRQQRLGVGVERSLHQLLGRGQLDQLAGIHDGDAVTDVGHDAQVVADEEIGEAELALQVREQVEHVGLDGDIEGRHHLVADDQPRLSTSARAMLARCFWPPEISCG